MILCSLIIVCTMTIVADMLLIIVCAPVIRVNKLSDSVVMITALVIVSMTMLGMFLHIHDYGVRDHIRNGKAPNYGEPAEYGGHSITLEGRDRHFTDHAHDYSEHVQLCGR
jgi:hypothetical protein